MSNVENFFSKQEKTSIMEAIRKAKKRTSGEIVLRVESSCAGDPLKRTIELFEQLEMHRTASRNGVLIYIAVDDRKFAVFGDTGVSEIVPDGFWDDVLDAMRRNFKEGKFLDGVVEAIELTAVKLQIHFPRRDDDTNELPDEISFSEIKTNV